MGGLRGARERGCLRGARGWIERGGLEWVLGDGERVIGVERIDG